MHRQHIPIPKAYPAGPTHCPYGHPLTGGRVLVGWMPCPCEWAMVPDWDGQPIRGHRTYQCVGCDELRDRRRTIDYWPPHKIDRG